MSEKISLSGNKCYRCSHVWPPRDKETSPKVCPSCKTPYWDRPRKSKKPSPKKIVLAGYKCYRCSHVWPPRSVDYTPKVCPSCKTPYWDRPRKNPVKSATKNEK